MNTNTSTFKFLRSAGIISGVAAMAMLASPLQAQYVVTVVSNGVSEPYGATVDPGNNLYFTDTVSNSVLKFVPGTTTKTILATGFNMPEGIVYASGRGGLVVADAGNQVLKYVSLSGTVVSNLAGTNGVFGTNDGPALGGAQFCYPSGIAVGNDGKTIYVADQQSGAIRMLSTNNIVSTIATTFVYNSTTNHLLKPTAVAVDNHNNIWIADSFDHVICVMSNGVGPARAIAGVYRTSGSTDGAASSAKFYLPSGLVWDNSKSQLVISDTDNNTVRALYVTNGTYAVQTIDGLAGLFGLVDGGVSVARFAHPYGICIDPYDNGYYVADLGNSAVRSVRPTLPPPPPQPIAAPTIGYVTYTLQNGTLSSHFNPITSPIAVFNNVATLAIEQFDGSVETYMTYGPAGTTIPAPTTNSFNITAYTQVNEGQPPGTVPTLSIPTAPDTIIEAFSAAPARPSSDTVSAEVQYTTANPNVVGYNAAALILSNSTAGAQMYYTLNGTDPTNNGSSIGPISSGTQLSLNLVSNITLLKVRAFTTGFAPSQIVGTELNISNFLGNELTFGFTSGVGSSKFVTAPGRTFFAPVTLTELPGTSIFSLQFDITESDTNFPIGTNTWGFTSMLRKPTTNNYVVSIDPGFVVDTNTVTNAAYITTNRLAELSWITVPPETNLYPTVTQDLTSYSEIQGYGFFESGGQVIIGAFSMNIPLANAAGNTYTISMQLPSASTFASQTTPTPPINVPIQLPTNNTFGAGTLNSIKHVTVTTNTSYLVGDVFPFGWLNAGDFGDSRLQNDDVIAVYISAVGVLGTKLNVPPPSSDYYDAMDSASAGYSLYDGNDSDINAFTVGDGTLDVNDVYVTLRRSLDTNLTWYTRTWSGSGLTVTPFTNFSSSALASAASTNAGTPRPIAVAADQVQAGGNLTVDVPVRIVSPDATHAIRVMLLNFEIDPLDGSPPITNAVSFFTGANFNAPTMSTQGAVNNFNAAWLDSTVAGCSGTNVLGTLSVTLPPNVNSNSAYRVHFNKFSASPNGLALFVPSVQDGLITVGNRSGSSWHDGISDAWRLLWFGTVSNALSAANADPDHDGASNWHEFVAGTDPNNSNSVFRCLSGCTLTSTNFTLQWSSVGGKHYAVQTSYSLTPGATWSTLATNLVGNGSTLNWTDGNAPGKTRFYRAIAY